MDALARNALLAPEPGPATLKTRRWGGSRLAALRNAPSSIERPIGESWEFSTMPGSESRSGGQPLSARLGRSLPFLVKLIDTALPLSIQVHPDDDAAAGPPGKEEAWIVLDADPGARFLAGIRAGVDATNFAATVRNAVAEPQRGAELLSMLAPIPAQRGTVVLVPAGTVHAIGAGILLGEIQQPADCTFRLFDYGSGRDLHVEEALAVTRVDSRPVVWQPGDAATCLRGKHLALEILGPGRYERNAMQDELLVVHGRTCIVDAEGAAHPLPAGALRLVTTGHRYRIEIPLGAGMVVGAMGSLGPTTELPART